MIRTSSGILILVSPQLRRQRLFQVGGRKKKKKQREESNLSLTAGSGNNGDHAVGHPKRMLASAAETARVVPVPGAAGSLINLG